MKFYIYFVLAILLMMEVSAAHFVYGKVSDSEDMVSADGHMVVLYRDDNENLTSMIGNSETCNTNCENLFMIDCEMFNIPCEPGEEFKLKVFNTGDNYFTREVSFTIDSAGVTRVPDQVLMKDSNGDGILDADDADVDGYPVGADCDDSNPLVNPGHVEECGNGLDDNCNGEIDEDCNQASSTSSRSSSGSSLSYSGSSSGCIPQYDDCIPTEECRPDGFQESECYDSSCNMTGVVIKDIECEYVLSEHASKEDTELEKEGNDVGESTERGTETLDVEDNSDVEITSGSPDGITGAVTTDLNPSGNPLSPITIFGLVAVVVLTIVFLFIFKKKKP